MEVYLGNLKLEEIEKRLGIVLSDEDKANLNSFKCESADVETGKWHCFDIPFMFVCGDEDAARKVVEILTPYAKGMKTELQIGFR